MKLPLTVAALCVLEMLPLRAAEVAKPNIVIIYIDDLGYADIGPFGATKQKTPNLDRMAREGMKLTSFYAAPVCSVSRAQLLTGCYGARVSVPAVFFPGGKNGLNPAEITIAEHLKAHGYATACIGKWHVGDQPEFLPTRQGFDRYVGLPYSNDMQRQAMETTFKVVPLMRDEKVAELISNEGQSRLVELYTEEAVRFIHEKKDVPFFLYLPHSAVHLPHHPGPKFAGKSQNGAYGDWVEEMDWSVGRVLDTLREEGHDERTLVLFSSDNGPAGKNGSALPLRGTKGSTWEGGMREPAIARWPGKIAASTECKAVTGTIDLLPTALALIGEKPPAAPVIDGRDILPLLLGKTTESPREAHYYFSSYQLQAVRQGPWKLAITAQKDGMGGKTSTDSEANPRLYHLETEIGEVTDVAAAHPDVVARLMALATAMNAEIGGANPKSRRPAGEVAHPKMLYTPAPEEAGEAPRPVELGQLKIGDALASGAAPQVGKKAFSLSCVIEAVPRDGIVFAQGGVAAGYALHLRNGRVAFIVRTGRDGAFEEISAPLEAGSTARVKVALAADGTMTLAINSEPPVTGKARGLLLNQPAEDFCLGHDNKNPVGAYSSTEKFTGRISELRLSTP